MNDIGGVNVSCLCGWSGIISAIPLDFSLDNFLICPQCSSPDLIYESKQLEKTFHARRQMISSHFESSSVYSNTKDRHDITPDSVLMVLCRIGAKVYQFNTNINLTDPESSFVVIDTKLDDLNQIAADMIKDQNLSTKSCLGDLVREHWGVANFATILAYYRDIADRVEKDIDQFQPTLLGSVNWSKP